MFGSSLDDYLHLLVPPVVKLFDSADIPFAVRKYVGSLKLFEWFLILSLKILGLKSGL